MTTPKQVPLRSCVVCHEKSGKRTLTRIVRTETGIVLDATGKLNGRGAYLCDKPECWHAASTSDALVRALRASLTASDRDLLRLHVS